MRAEPSTDLARILHSHIYGLRSAGVHLGGQGERGYGLLTQTCNHLTSAYSQSSDKLKAEALCVEAYCGDSKQLPLDDDDGGKVNVKVT